MFTDDQGNFDYIKEEGKRTANVVTKSRQIDYHLDTIGSMGAI